MCMKNLNATILTCVEAKRNSASSNALTYDSVFDIIIPKDIDGKMCVSGIDIVVDLSAIFDDKQNTDIYIEKDKDYNCRLAVTFDGEKFKGICDFTFSTSSSRLSKCGDRSFCNVTLLVNGQSFEIPDNANSCDLVLLIKHPPQSDNGKWILQTIRRLYINKPTQ